LHSVVITWRGRVGLVTAKQGGVVAMWGRVRFVAARHRKATVWWRPAGCGASIAWRITVWTRSGKVAFGGDSYAQAMYGWRSNAIVGQGMILYCAGGVR
jgi:hypothetical protein